MLCSKHFSCLFKKPCLSKGKSNLSVPNVFPLTQDFFPMDYVLIK